MYSFKVLSISIAVIASFMAKTVMAEITAWNQENCQGEVGGDVSRDKAGTQCWGFTNRKSFNITSGAESHCVRMFSDTDCKEGGVNYPAAFPICLNVRDTPKSFRCFSDLICDDKLLPISSL
ncbi:hypothetical protein CVT25_009242 [Psilocybe cyanescens]|uniref:Secreted protein n=1 Tax=Psilocybe cyanescens TaxID=93625 RepID=A0A409XTD4_PSICY|nr:hypothetical protein CVT25_009242 [Psilocybe cyanescens]